MVTIDAQGRFGLPARLRDAYGIGAQGSKVTVDGQGDRLEIRAADRPDEAMPEVDTVVGMWKHR
jgi:bifunctional DNA-binding transcriptional regulator/antitoxin component of YhaV-PrlF toxin-antitoxin module